MLLTHQVQFSLKANLLSKLANLGISANLSVVFPQYLVPSPRIIDKFQIQKNPHST